MVCVSKSLQGLQDFGNEEIIAMLFAIFAVFKVVFRVRSASTGPSACTPMRKNGRF